MKKIVTLITFAVLCQFSSADGLDKAVAALQSGSVKSIAEKQWKEIHTESVKKDFGRYKEVFEAHRQAAASCYSAQVKWSIIRPKSHGGYPYRSALFRKEFERYAIYKILKADYEKAPTPLKAYTLICPAIIARNDALIEQLKKDLSSDKYLSALLEKKFNNWENYLERYSLKK